ncbi:MAG: AI-2E family transporter [Candidatus Moranbacteria bacterium]|nr:AI-2E family transporter [Candidatus Moranbacteria bacterium]
MKATHFNVNFFFIILTGVGILMFFILQPFLTAILAAAILAALFQGWYQSILKRIGNHRHAAAALSILVIAAIIIVPLATIFGVAINEANVAYDRIIAGETSTGQISFTALLEKIQSLPYVSFLLGGQSFDMAHLANSLKGFSQDILGFVKALYQGVAEFIFWLIVMFFSLFYFLIDGKRLVQYGMSVMPLRNEHEKILIDKFVSMSRATLRGTLIVSIVQGFLGGVMFAIAGVPSPVIWGLIMAVMSVIPLVGVGVVWLPAGIILLFMGQVWQGIFVLALGASIISTVDNVLGPKLVGRDTQMHPLLIFFATLGGLSFFGVPGFIIGPIIASLALALLDIYALEFKTQLKQYNE